MIQGGRAPVVGLLASVVLLAAAVIYLYIRVGRLEQKIGDRRRPARPQNTKVIPILKDQIEPGPFKKGNRLRERKPNEPEE